MNRLNWCFGVVSVLVAASACSSKSDGTGVVPQAGAGGMATGAGGTAGASGGSSGMPAGGAATGGTGGAGGSGPALATPTEVAHVDGCGYMALTISKGVIYFTDSAHGNVSSVPVAGGTVTNIATGQKAPYALAVDDAGVVYWSNTSATVGTDNTLMMQAPGGMPTKIADIDQTSAQAGKTNIVKRLTLDGQGNIYYGTRFALMKVQAKAAGMTTKIGTFDGEPIAIVLTPPAPAAATRIFASLNLDNAVQWRSPDPTMSGCTDPVSRPLPKAGESPADALTRENGGGCAWAESVGALLYEPLSLAGKFILFLDGTDVDMADTTVAATMQASRGVISGSGGPDLSFDPLSGFTNTSTVVYFGESTTGTIEKVPVPAAVPTMQVAPVVIAQDKTKIVNPTSFVNDGTSFYFRTGATPTDSCVIMKLPL
jgi:hypothetical protein